MAVMPPWEADEWDVFVGELSTAVWLTVVWRKPEMRDAEPCLKPFLPNEPPGFRWALLLAIGPGVEAGCHQGLVSWEIHHRADAKWRDELAATDGSMSRHF